jgi:hypothetical protein
MPAHLKRWWNGLIGLPARAFMRRMLRRHPQKVYDGIPIIVADSSLTPHAKRLLDQTERALRLAHSVAPRAYSNFRKDVLQVLLWDKPGARPYHRFQRAAIVPRQVALESSDAKYAAWLLYVSGLPYGEGEARARSEQFLVALPPDERVRVAEWLTSMSERGPPE